MALGDKLHVLDQELCRILCGNFTRLLHYPLEIPEEAFRIDFDGSKYLSEMFPDHLCDHVRRSNDIFVPRIVLDENELMYFLDAAQSLPNGFVLYWKSNQLLLSQWRDTLEEVAQINDVDQFNHWKYECTEYERYFDDAFLFFDQGAEAVIGWIQELHEILLKMGLPSLVPARFDEPANSRQEMNPSLSRPRPGFDLLEEKWKHPSDDLIPYMERLRTVIAKEGAETSSNTILRSAGGKRAKVLEALRCLAYRNEYAGFKTRSKIPLAMRGGFDTSQDLQ
jgi:hypothetical protein